VYFLLLFPFEGDAGKMAMVGRTRKRNEEINDLPNVNNPSLNS
jgi:hypothetical protein